MRKVRKLKEVSNIGLRVLEIRKLCTGWIPSFKRNSFRVCLLSSLSFLDVEIENQTHYVPAINCFQSFSIFARCVTDTKSPQQVLSAINSASFLVRQKSNIKQPFSSLFTSCEVISIYR